MSKKIGELAVEKGYLSQKELVRFLLQTKKKIKNKEEGSTLEQILLEQEIISEATLQELLRESSSESLQKKQSAFEEKNRYQVIKELGQGGMGVVHLVKDSLLGREVALKRTHLKQQNISKSQELLLWRLHQEAFITAKLEHPNIIPLYEMQQQNDGSGELQFTMRKVHGETLKGLFQQIRKQQTEWDIEYLLAIFLKVCDAVAYAHSKGIIHRDLKPENIMVGEFGEVYVMDWGIAKKFKSAQTEEEKSNFLEKKLAQFTHYQESEIGSQDTYETIGGLGTLGYMPPEQLENASQVTPKADIYALGKILKECFSLISPIEVFQQLQQKIKINLSVQEPIAQKVKIPKDILAIVEKATQENPEKRYSTIQNLIEDVKSYQHGIQISAREYPLLELLLKWCKRNKRKITLIGVVFFFCSVSIYLTWWYQIQQKIDKFKQQIVQEKLFFADLESKLRQNIVNQSHRQDILRDISKMNPEAVLAPLIDILKEGTEYYLKNQKRETIKEQFYLTMVVALGWLEVEDAKAPLLKSIEKIKPKMLNILGQNFVSDEDYFVTLFGALANVDTPETYRYLKKLRLSFREGSSFREKTKEHYRKVARKRVLSEHFKIKEKFTFDELCERGEVYFALNHFEKAVENYTLAIQLNPEKAQAYSGRGNAYNELGQLEKAIEDYTKAIFLNPKNAKNHSERGRLWYEKREWDKAIKDLTKAIQLDTKDTFAYSFRGLCRNEKGKPEQAIQDFEKALTLNPYDANIHYYQGIVNFRKGEPQKAIINFSKAIQLYHQFTNAYIFRGMANFEMKNFKEALKDYNQALSFDSWSNKAYLERGQVKFKLGDLKGALTDYDFFLRYAPKTNKNKNIRFSSYHNTIGMITFELGDIKRALLEYNKAIALNPNYWEAYLNRGSLKFKVEKFDDALKDYNNAIKISPSSFELYINRGSLFQELGKLAKALSDFNQAIRLDSQSAKAFCCRGKVKFEQKNYNESIKDFNQALKLDPLFDKAYYGRGLTNFAQRKWAKALSDFNETIKLEPKFAYAYFNRALAKHFLKDLAGAIEDYTITLKLEPNNPVFNAVYNKRGSAKYENGDLKGAFKDFNQALEIDPTFAMAYLNRGEIELSWNKLEKALLDYDQAIKFDPKLANAYLRRGILKRQLGNFEEALLDFNQVIELDSSLPDAYLGRGLILCYFKNKPKMALLDFDKAIKLNPKFASAYANRGNIKRDQKDYIGAIKDYSQAIKYNISDLDIYNERGIAKFQAKDFEGAIADFEYLRKHKPTSIEARRNLAKTYEKIGDLEQSIFFFEELFQYQKDQKIVTEFLDVLWKRATIYYRNKEFELLEKDLLKFIKYAPKNHSKLKRIHGFLENIKKKKQQQK